MKALVVYDSVFGNTGQIAQSIGAALGTEALKVDEVQAEHLAGVALLAVGSPTRAFRPTPATVKFLKGLPAGSLKGVKVAAFDTRASLEDVNSVILNFFVKIFGYAAEPMLKLLQRKGGEAALPPEGFFVLESEGPLKEGELERAAAWIRQALD
jgi:flavodoxin